MSNEELFQAISSVIKTEINQRFEEQNALIEKRLAEQDRKFEKKLEELEQKFEKRFEELDQKFEKKIAELDQKFSELEDKFESFKKEVVQIIEKTIMHQMFVFETQYGDAMKIAIENFTARSSNEEIQNQRLDVLEKHNTTNTAYVYAHEKRISNLENNLKIV